MSFPATHNFFWLSSQGREDVAATTVAFVLMLHVSSSWSWRRHDHVWGSSSFFCSIFKAVRGDCEDVVVATKAILFFQFCRSERNSRQLTGALVETIKALATSKLCLFFSLQLHFIVECCCKSFVEQYPFQQKKVPKTLLKYFLPLSLWKIWSRVWNCVSILV